jgi:hypothetical protein
MSSLQNQYNSIKKGKGNKDGLLRESKRLFPNYIPNSANYKQAIDILKSRQIINENVVGLQPINQLQPAKKENFEKAFEKFLAEETVDAKATERKQSKLVDEPLSHQYPYQEKDRLDNQIFDQIMSGYYTEMKDPKNADKTEEELKAIVLKNLEKDPLYYTNEAQFGIKGLGYRDDVPGAGLVKEPTGKYKASGYGDLKESKQVAEASSMPSEELLSLLDDMLEDLVDTSVDAEQAVKKVISRNPALKHYETALLQLAEPKFP